MSSTPAYSSKAQVLTVWLVRRAAVSLLGISLGYTTWTHVAINPAFSQTAGTAANETVGRPTTDALLRPTLKPGSRGSEVTELQATLKLLGYYGGTVDGVYGQTTVSAVSQFQQAAGLNADGITGPATWNRLFPAGETSGTAASKPNASNTATTPPAVNSTSAPAASSAASFPVPSGATPTPSSSPPATSPRPAVKPAPGTTPKPNSTTTPKPNNPTPETRPAAASTVTTESVALPVLRQGMKGSAVIALQQRLRSFGVFKGSADGVFGAETLAAVKAAQRNLRLAPDGVVGAATWSGLLR